MSTYGSLYKTHIICSVSVEARSEIASIRPDVQRAIRRAQAIYYDHSARGALHVHAANSQIDPLPTPKTSHSCVRNRSG
jgi:hypothetical protein